MRIIADENLHTVFLADLRQNGYDVLSVRESYPGVSDLDVVSLTKAEGLMLITD